MSSIKTQQHDLLNFESELTFAPKLNASSIKLARERGEKMRNGPSNRRLSNHNTEEEQTFTFKPRVSTKSVKIVQNLKTTFLDRQLMHMEKQKRHISEEYSPPKHLSLSPVQIMKSPAKIRSVRFKGNHESKEDKSNDLQHYTRVTRSTSSCDLSNPVSNTSSTTDVENDKEEENENEEDNNSSKSPETNQDCLGSRLKEESPYNQSVENLYMNKRKRAIRVHQRGATYPVANAKTKEEKNEDWNGSTRIRRKAGNNSRTSSQGHYVSKMKYDHPLFEKVRHAKEVAESAVKHKKVFICHGPYPIVRASLRRRGYVEKNYKGSPLIKKKSNKHKANNSDEDSGSSDDDSDDCDTTNPTPRQKVSKEVSKPKETPSKEAGNKKERAAESRGYTSSDDDDDDDDDDSDDEDWKAGYEEGGPDSEFNLMSRMVRNAVASFIWTVRRDDIDFKYLRKDQIVNHFSRAYSFTTKVGLCSNLRNLSFYEEVDHRTFFPRCHRLGAEDDKLDFIDDFQICAAISIIKWVITLLSEDPSGSKSTLPAIQEPKDQASRENDSKQDDIDTSKQDDIDTSKQDDIDTPVEADSMNVLPVKALTSALNACRDYLRRQDHLDVDDPIDSKPAISEVLWDEIIDYSYQLRQSHTVIEGASPFLRECQNIINKFKDKMPQIDLDGQRNIWIVKPGAKSRGRGIMCMDRLEDILKLTGNIIGQKEGRWVVQKYIECPLLIYSVKFDIRQWFLVTDWNPLTVWFYQDCYLRFCSHNFSLEDFHVSIHLANNSVQKHFEIDKVRDKRLPEENMWSSDEFKLFLKKKGLNDMWDNVIYPGMKQSVIHAMQSCQEIVEYRKNSFELYGADFIIADDYKPWLIEINCSPTMGASTGVTRKLCAQVVEDVMKVVVDRREDKNCDTGRFELAFKQPHITAPPYIGVNLAVEGQAITRKPNIHRRPSTSAKLTNLSRPRDTKNALNDTIGEKHLDKRPSVKPQPVPQPVPQNDVKRCEGSWALGRPSQTRSPTEENIAKTVRMGSISGSHRDVKTQSQMRVARTMTIPKAILRYSSDKTVPPSTQLPISIGLD